MRIVVLVKGSQHVCCRYRIAAYRPTFEEAGFEVQIRGWPDNWLSRVMFYHFLRECDALIIQRKLLPLWQLRMIRNRVRWLIYDYDDSVFLHNSYNPSGSHSAQRAHRFEETVRLADAVVAGNAFLAEQARPCTDPERVHVIPTCVDLADYPLAEHDAGKPRVDLVWIGSSSTIKGLERIAPLLDEVGKNVPGAQLKIICDRSLRLENLPVVFCPWKRQTETLELADSDVGISWLPDDAWSEGKCGLKVLQYMAAGLPVVANPVGLQRTLVRHGKTGFLADTPAEWAQALRLLTNDPALRRRMGQAGRRMVEAHYQVPVGAAAWMHVLRTLTPVARVALEGDD